MTKSLITFFIVLEAQSSYRQQFTDLYGDYLEQIPPGNTVFIFDGNVYKTVTIGTQVWMVENLKTITYRNGDLI